MARVTFDEAKEQGSVDIADKFLAVDTLRDGFTDTYTGTYSYRVIQDENGDYTIYPIYRTHDGTLVNAKYPIIRTDGDLILFSVRTTVNPYNFAYPETYTINEGDNKELRVLDAFHAFIKDQFALGGPTPYNVFIDDDKQFGVDDPTEDFQFTTKYERELIHPDAGRYGDPSKQVNLAELEPEPETKPEGSGTTDETTTGDTTESGA